MAVKIKRIRRIAVAVKDLEKSIEHWKKMLGIEPFIYGIEEEAKYHWCAFELGEGEVNMEFLSPWNDPEGTTLIGKFIKNRGEGLYMVTMQTAGTADETVDEMRFLGMEPSWGSVNWEGENLLRGNGEVSSSWQEHYIPPKHANGVLITLATIGKRQQRVVNVGAAAQVKIAGTSKK